MFSSRANTWAPKTENPDGLRVTLVKKRNLPLDHGIGDHASKESQDTKWNPMPRWAVESSDPCRLVIKRRKTVESSVSNQETCVSGERGLKVRIVASTKTLQDNDASLSRIKNWCKEQISASLPSTCYDKFLSTDLTLQPSPKCTVSEASLSSELFHLQPSPKDSGIDVSSPPRRFDEIHLADTVSLLAAAEVSVASLNAAVAGKEYRTNVHCEKTVSVKQRNKEGIKKAVTEDTNVNLQTTQVLPRHSRSKRMLSVMPAVAERNRLLLRLSTSAFQAQLTGSDNNKRNKKNKSKKRINQMDTEHLSTMNETDSDTCVKYQFVQDNENLESSRKHQYSKVSSEVESEFYSVSLCKNNSKAVKQTDVKTVKDAGFKVQDNLNERISTLLSQEVKKEAKNLNNSSKFSESAANNQCRSRNQIFQTMDRKINISDENYSLSDAKRPKNTKNNIRNASKFADNKAKESSNTVLKSVCKRCTSTVTELKEVASEQVSRTTSGKRNIKNQSSSVASESLSDSHAQTTDRKTSDVCNRVAAETSIRIRIRNRSSVIGGNNIIQPSPVVTGSAVELNSQNVTEKTNNVMPGSENCSETCLDLDKSLSEECVRDISSMKSRSSLISGLSIDKLIGFKDRGNLPAKTEDQVIDEPAVEDKICEDDAEHLTTLGPGSTAVSAAPICVPLKSKRLTRSSVNKQLAGFNVETATTQREFKVPTCPIGMSDSNIASRTSVDDCCCILKEQLCSNATDFPKTRKNAITVESPLVQKDLVVKPSKIESAKILPETLSRKKPRRNNSASRVKKRNTVSRKFTSKQSSEHLFHANESLQLSQDDDILTMAESENKKENCNRTSTSFLFESANRSENKSVNDSQLSGYGEKKTEPSEYCHLSLKETRVKFKDEMLLPAASKSSFDEGVRVSVGQNVSNSFSSPCLGSRLQDIGKPNLEVSQNIETSVNSEKLFHSDVSLSEPSGSVTATPFSSKSDIKLKLNTKSCNNYIDEFAKFVSIQHLSSADTCSSRAGDMELNASVVMTEENSLSSSEEEILVKAQSGSKNSFCVSSLFETKPELGNNTVFKSSVQFSPQTDDSMQQEFPPMMSLILPEDDKSRHCLSVRNSENSTKIDSVIATLEKEDVGDYSQSLISENFSVGSVVSIDRELKKLRSKVAELLRNVFPGLLLVRQERSFLELPRFLDQVLDSVLCVADDKMGLPDCLCDVQVTLCRKPLNCLRRLQNKVLKLLRFLLPSCSLEGIAAEEIELLVEAVTLANSAKLTQEQHGNSSDSCNFHYESNYKVDTLSDDGVCTSDVESLCPTFIDIELHRRR